MLRSATVFKTGLNTPFCGIGINRNLRYVQSLSSIKADNVDRVPVLDLDDFKTSFASRSLWEIIRALFVFKVCSYDVVVANSLKLMQTSKRVLGRRLYEKAMRMTVYGQFVGGATKDEITCRVQNLNTIGVGALLFIPIEEAVGEEREPGDIYDNNLHTVKNCIRLAKVLDESHPMAQLKLTALVPVELCKTISRLIPDPHTKPDYIDAIAKALEGDSVEFNSVLSDQDALTLSKSLARIKEVCELAESLGVLLWVDAEYTYLNPALRLISLAMMLKTNKHRPVIAYTYQNYLKETYEVLKRDVEFTSSRNVCFGAKLVRGAYMVRERQMALEHGYPDPIHDTFDGTSDMYHTSMTYLMDKVRHKPDRYFMIVASHNENTVQLALQTMASKRLSTDNGAVFFGQIYGMSDYLSNALGKSGYLVYKSIPFGTIEETIPYLHRRAMENTAVLGETRRERKILINACLNRLTFGLLPLRS